MKLSDFLSSLTDGARQLEGRIEEWNKSLSAQGEEAMAKAKEWQQQAEQRSEEWRQQFMSYAAGVDDDLKQKWEKLQGEFEAQIVSARKQAEEWRNKADAADAEATAKWHEAYAANMVLVAKRAEQEASQAIAAAAEARAKVGK